MSTTNRASAKWHKKKLEENAKEFRAKEASRIRAYRAQAKKCQRSHQGNTAGDVSVLQDANEMPDDVDSWFNNVVETCHSSPSEKSPLVSSPASPSTSSIKVFKNPENNDETFHSRSPLKTLTFQDTHAFVANAQRTLQEWNRRWGTSANFWHRAMQVPADRALEELTEMIRKGREALLQMESIALIDLRSIHVDEFRDFWINVVRVVEGLYERVAQAEAVLQLRLGVQIS